MGLNCTQQLKTSQSRLLVQCLQEDSIQRLYYSIYYPKAHYSSSSASHAQIYLAGVCGSRRGLGKSNARGARWGIWCKISHLVQARVPKWCSACLLPPLPLPLTAGEAPLVLCCCQSSSPPQNEIPSSGVLTANLISHATPCHFQACPWLTHLIICQPKWQSELLCANIKCCPASLASLRLSTSLSLPATQYCLFPIRYL